MKASVYRVYLQDEIPKLPCGWRYLIAQIGRKWVYIRDYDKYIHDCNTQRMRLRRATWDKLNATLSEKLDEKASGELNAKQ